MSDSDIAYFAARKPIEERRERYYAAERVTFAAIAEAGGQVLCDEDGYTLYLDGDCVGIAPDLAGLADLFAEAEAQRIADAVLAQIAEETR